MKNEIKTISELFWKFHNDRLANPNLTKMDDYIKPILEIYTQLFSEIEAELKPEGFGNGFDDLIRISTVHQIIDKKRKELE